MNTNNLYKYPSAILFAIVYLCLLPYFQHKIVTDMVSYLTMSKHIAAGNFFESVNAYWSPLICWLVAPLIKLGIEGVLAYKLWNLIAGMIVLVQLHNLTSTYIQLRWQQLLVTLLAIPQLLYFALCNATPDVIALACWFVFFNHFRTLLNTPSIRNAIVTGCLAALCYFGKYYNFYAACCFYAAAIGFILYLRKPENLKPIFLSFVIFIGISFIWIAILHAKFGSWAPTSASDFNRNLLLPGGFMHPMQVGDVLLPIDYNQFTITSWENPLVYPIPYWSPLQDWESLRFHFAVHIRENFMHFRNKHPVEVCFFGLSLILAVVYRKKYTIAEWVLLASILLYPIGYFWMVALSRYTLFSMLAATLWVIISFNKIPKYRWMAWSLMAVGIVYSLKITYRRMDEYPDKGLNYYTFYQSVSEHYPISNKRILSSHTTWTFALYFAYYSQCRLYDVLKPELLKANAKAIKQMGIDYYFCSRNEVPEELVPNIVFEGEWVLVALP